MRLPGFLTIILVTLAGCSQTAPSDEEAYRNVLAQCLAKVDYAREFMKLCPNAYAYIVGFKASHGRQLLVLRGQLHERYEFILKVDIMLDRKRTNLVSFGLPEIVVNEIKSVNR